MTQVLPSIADHDHTDSPVDTILSGGLIEKRVDGWAIKAGTSSQGLSAEATVPQIIEAFETLIRTEVKVDRRCVLALPAMECFLTTLPPSDASDSKDAMAVAYELERVVPIDAESMVVDHWIRPQTKQLVALSTSADRHRDLAEAIERARIELVAIVPSAFLVARAVADWRTLSEPFRLAIFDDGGCDHLVFDPTGIADWKHCADATEWVRHQAVWMDNDAEQDTLVVVGRNDLDVHVHPPVQWCPLAPSQLLARGAVRVLEGRWGRWANLRRGGLAAKDPLVAIARPLRWLSLAAIVACLSVISAAWYRGSRIQERSESVRAAQRAAYRETFPERRPPVMLMRSVRSEYQNVLGSRGRGDGFDLPKPATAALADVLAGLTRAKAAGARFRLLELDIADGACSLTVRARDAVQIGTIAKSLKQSGFEVQPPAAQQIEPGREEPIPTFQSTITAVWLGKTDAARTLDNGPAGEDSATFSKRGTTR